MINRILSIEFYLNISFCLLDVIIPQKPKRLHLAGFGFGTPFIIRVRITKSLQPNNNQFIMSFVDNARNSSTILDSGRVVSVQVYRDEAARDNDNGLDWIALFVTQMNVSRFK